MNEFKKRVENERRYYRGSGKPCNLMDLLEKYEQWIEEASKEFPSQKEIEDLGVYLHLLGHVPLKHIGTINTLVNMREKWLGDEL